MLNTASGSKDDGNVARSAQLQLQRQVRDIIRDVGFDLNEDAIVLRGHARSFYHKQLAQEAIRSIAGPLRVVNNIEVTERLADCPKNR